MPDITMCKNEECPLHTKCYRFIARADKLQSYSDFKYKNNECSFFTPATKKEIESYEARDGRIFHQKDE